MSHVAFPIVWAIGMLVFAGIIAGRARLLLRARPAARFDRIPERLRRALVYGVGQRKFLRGEQPAGIMHALIFWGFVVLMIQVVMLFGRTFDASWDIPGFGADQLLGPPFFLARDLLELIVIVGVRLHALPAADRPHAAPVRPSRRAEQRYRDAPHWEGVADPLLHPVHHGRRAAVRRRPAGRGRHPRQRAGLRAGERGGGRRARRPQPLVGADRQRGRMVAALHDDPRLPVPAAAVQALPHHHRDPQRLLREAPAARRGAAAGDHARAGGPGGRARALRRRASPASRRWPT